MSTKEFDLLVFVGRFQPPHLGHLAVIEEALRHSQKLLILVGSANRSRSLRDPFSFEERAEMLRAMTGEIRKNECGILDIRPLNDHLYNDPAWIEEVQSKVTESLSYIPGEKKRVGIIGHAKDHTSYYLRVFPGYECVDVEGYHSPNVGLLNSTMIRELAYDFLTNQGNRGWDLFHFQDYLPEQMIRHFQYALKSPDMRGVIAEAEFVKRYKDQWKFAPYKPTFNTVDAVVQCCGHVLMVMRGEQPGAGNFALPGGFIGQNEPLLDACIRELFEETQISVPRPVVLGSLHRREARVFDDPHRSSRGRTITHAYRFDLADKELPRVRGGDDAAAAMWIPINAVKPEKTFEDHAFIIRAMLGVS